MTDTESVALRPGVAKRWVAVGLSVLLLATGLSFVLGLVVDDANFPNDNSSEAGFARDMASHHAQAVNMGEIVRKQDGPPDLRILASDIVLTQQAQIGQMQGWLAVWGLRPAGGGEAMAWMNGSGSMPGMATNEDLARLEDATGADKEKLFLQLMIPHHEGGVVMAQAILDRTERGEVRRLAQAIVSSQTAELTVLRDMLRTYDPNATTTPATPHIMPSSSAGH
jgi:uncharacterized protein (DUF305 family)